MEIAERIRRAVAEKLYDVETSSEPIRATVSIGVAGFPKDAQDPNALIHQADLAVYRAKLQGRNRVLGASSEPLLMPADRTQRLVAVPEEGDHREPLARVPEALPEQERRHTAHTTSGPRFLQLSLRLGVLVGLVSSVGIAAGVVGAIFGSSTDMIGLLAVVALVSVGEALALELDDGSISVSAVGALAGAALFGPRAALVARRRDLRRPVERAAPADPPRALQHRHAHALVARGDVRLHARLRRARSGSSSPSPRASSPAASTSRSTRACSPSRSPSRAARTSGGSGTSASSGSRRTTSSTASSAA